MATARKKSTPKAAARRKATQAQTKAAQKAKKRYPAPQAASDDIIRLILADHKPLKECIQVMKDDDKPEAERRSAFEKFSTLLVLHAQAEEQSLYTDMKKHKDMRMEAFEGDVEHGLADQVLEETKRTEDKDVWFARVKVLAVMPISGRPLVGSISVF
jgi:hypothetical protein